MVLIQAVVHLEVRLGVTQLEAGFISNVLQDDDADKRLLTLEKNNYARIGNEINLRWEDGCFKFDPQSSGLDFKAATNKARRVFLRLLEEQIENGQNVNKNGGSTYAPKFLPTIRTMKV